MRKNSAVLLLFVALCLLTPMIASAGIIVPVPEIDPASARGGIALVIASAALILERRRRR